MWKTQLDFNKRLFDIDNLSETEKVRYTKEMLLHMLSEVDELLSATGSWKMHKNEGQIPLKSGITEELVDLFKYVINIAVIWNITPKDFVEMFSTKSEVVLYKLLTDKRLDYIRESGLPTILVDLDGTLNSYPKEWLKFFNDLRSRNCKTVEEAKKYKDYANLHDVFREHDGELSFEVNTVLRSILNDIKTSYPQVQVVVLTSRPVWRNKRYFADTLKWLRNNKVPFDGIVWGFDKAEEVKRFENVVCVIEDDVVFANNLASSGIPVILLSKTSEQEIQRKIVHPLAVIANETNVETFIYNLLHNVTKEANKNV
jgi:hypothetical protein